MASLFLAIFLNPETFRVDVVAEQNQTFTRRGPKPKEDRVRTIIGSFVSLFNKIRWDILYGTCVTIRRLLKCTRALQAQGRDFRVAISLISVTFQPPQNRSSLTEFLSMTNVSHYWTQCAFFSEFLRIHGVRALTYLVLVAIQASPSRLPSSSEGRAARFHIHRDFD